MMAVNLPLADVPFRDLMAERLGLPVFVDNDANGAMLAEWRFGAARGARDAALLTLGTGIGGGLVVGGALQRGSQGAGAELGHMVVQADGPRCQGNCPNRGCLEAMCSGTALAREATRIAARAARVGARPRARRGARDHRRARHRARARRRRRRHRRAGADRGVARRRGSRTS